MNIVSGRLTKASWKMEFAMLWEVALELGENVLSRKLNMNCKSRATRIKSDLGTFDGWREVIKDVRLVTLDRRMSRNCSWIVGSKAGRGVQLSRNGVVTWMSIRSSSPTLFKVLLNSGVLTSASFNKSLIQDNPVLTNWMQCDCQIRPDREDSFTYFHGDGGLRPSRHLTYVVRLLRCLRVVK